MKIGLALAGGGIKGAGHIGAIKALKENGIEIDCVGGTSIGSIVSALYAMDYSTDEMLKLFKYFAKDIMKIDPKYYWSNVKSKRNFMGYGLLSGERIEQAIAECAELKGLKNIKDIKMPICMPTTEITESKKYVFTNQETQDETKQIEYINDIPLGKAVRASASYPGVFAPTVFKGHKFVDGGIFDNLPTHEVRKLGADKVLSIRFSSEKFYDPKNLFEVALKSVDLLFDQRTASEVASSDYAITLDLPEANVFNIKKIDYCYNQGYITTLEHMKEIKEKDIRFHKDRNRLLKAIGNGDPNLEPTISRKYKLSSKTAFLLCTDGFWELIDEKEMIGCLRRTSNAKDWVKEMGAIVVSRGKGNNMDNVTAIGVRIK